MIIIILGIASYFTIMLAKNSVEQNSKNNMGQEQSMAQGTPPQMPNSNGSNETPPQKPDSDNTNGTSQQMQNSGNTNEAAPQMPSSGDTNGTPPQKLDSDNTNNLNDSTSDNKQMSENQNKEVPSMNGENNKVDIAYYILFGIEAFVISILIVYLVMSNFNKKAMYETLYNAKSILIFVITVIILAIGLTSLQIFATNKIISNNKENQEQSGMQIDGKGGETANNVSYTATKEITEDTQIDSGEFSSTTSNENAILTNGDIDVNISNVSVNKTGDSDGGDSSNFYGNNSAIIAKSKANLTLKNITVNTDANGANGVFSYGGSATTDNLNSDGTTVNISDSTITTTGNNAGGIMTTGGGTTNATNLKINTSGTSSAAIRSDRGGGTVNVNKGTYTTTGTGSPSIYSTANITASNATLEAKASEGIVIEGANSVEIDNCKLIDNNTKLNGQSTTYKNIFLYQSMSGDASNGTATFTAKDSQIETNKGDTFYITNTVATINLTNNTIVNNDKTGNFLRAQKDSWGNSGSNGGKVTLKMAKQNANGNIVVDSISTLDMTMDDGSYYEGTINGDNQAKSIALKLDSTSKIKLTGDSYVTSLEDDDGTYSNIDFNGYKLYVNGTAVN